ncbi:hypothetical protein HDU86_001681 [Geranomyces michiganensis]|nr:hypothetical protein HDU86_001681 [Geranomyces michiganensis]
MLPEILAHIVLLSGDHQLAISLNLEVVKKRLLPKLRNVRMSSANASWMIEYKIQPCNIAVALRILTEEDRVDILVHLRADLEPYKLQEVGLVCAWQGRKRVLRYLCKSGDLRARYDRVRLIDAAADGGHVDILSLLVEYGLAGLSENDAHDTDEDDIDEDDADVDDANGDDADMDNAEEDDADDNDTGGGDTGHHHENFRFMRIAAGAGHISFLRRALNLLPDIPAAAIQHAAGRAVMAGHLRVAQTLFAASGPPPPHMLEEDVVDNVATYGDLKTLKWIYANSYGQCSRNVIDAVAQRRSGDVLPIMRFLHKQGPQCSGRAMDYAAKWGDLPLVWFLHEQHHKCSVRAMDYAAERGNLSLVQFLHENRQEGCTPKAISNALMRGAVDVAEFLHENRSEGFICESWLTLQSTIPVRNWVRTHEMLGRSRASAYIGPTYRDFMPAGKTPLKPDGPYIGFLGQRIPRNLCF